ncbi:ornithine cyclodeaminase [Pseudomonas gingeri]|uniref:Ornithine cyclodeaminase n=1 Tax=Pseudomonas gingeri TaxID=117681 RepID=A0A7Y8CNR9_9PSED|nr:ornithine cyclodeaminase [Pseudomonas gingeri]NWB26167.1 ornithine cyclodeaminase [Pseudomonas gingeri]NWC36319.1 ornithine cyclodeaminase [Pseudomonas gingeri]
MLPVHDWPSLRAVLRHDAVVGAIREAFVRHADGQVVAPAPGELLFDQPPGDCHIKYGYFKGGPVFVIKIAMGFYDNALHGLPTNNGLMAVFDARTGQTLALLNDEGWLTSWRTAASGALAAVAMAPKHITALGILGTGHQAELQALWASVALGIDKVVIWGRAPHKAEALATRLREEGVDAHAATKVEALLQQCNVIITCTPATEPLFAAAAVRPGTHIVALGADSQGKQEIDPQLFQIASRVVADDIRQCTDRGDLGYAVRDGLLETASIVLLGDVLSGKAKGREREDAITIVDLTGLAAHDVAIATLAIEALPGPDTRNAI